MVVIQKTNLSLKKALVSNVAAARTALEGKTRQSSPMSATTPPSVTIASSVSTNEGYLWSMQQVKSLHKDQN